VKAPDLANLEAPFAVRDLCGRMKQHRSGSARRDKILRHGTGYLWLADPFLLHHNSSATCFRRAVPDLRRRDTAFV